MANTTDIMITSFFDDEAIEFINSKTGLGFQQITDGTRAGGPKVISFKAFGTCVRCIGKEKTDALIDAFQRAPFSSPEYAIMFIDDDNCEFNGSVTHSQAAAPDGGEHQ